jgi:hypothetical protein
MNKGSIFIIAFLSVHAFSNYAEAQKTIDYDGYRISVALPRTKDYSVVTVKKGRKTLARHMEGIAQDYGSNAELLSLLGSNKKQLVITQYTGGNHCCSLYWIYELAPRFRLLFRSKEFETIGYSEVNKLFQNIDDDPDMEIVDNTPAFHYFDDLAFVSSPAPTLIFDYNRRSRRFELANRRFSRYLLKDHEEWVTRTEALRGSNPSQHSVDSFGLFLDLVYAGREQAAWKYYRKEKTKSINGAYFHTESTIRQVLDAEPAYRSIYGK